MRSQPHNALDRARCTDTRGCFAVLGSLLTQGCRRKIAVAPPAPAPPPVAQPAAAPPEPTASLVAEPAAIERGQSITLKWSSTDSTEVAISGLGAVALSGSQVVMPLESVTYTLTATSPGGFTTTTGAVTVTVPELPAVPSKPERTFEERVNTDLTDVHFDYDKSDIREDARNTLVKDAAALRSSLADYPEGSVILEGHRDERGSAEYNLGLGDRRATSTNAFLEGLGVDTSRLKTISYGKERPQCAGSTEECWQKNHRVHFAAEEK